MTSRAAIAEAADRLGPHIRRTPVLRLAAGEGPGCAVALKLELLQASGSFKPRGAFNRLLTAASPPALVVAASGGNHGAAVAHAARALGRRAEIFVPEMTGPAKRALVEAAGARLVVAGAAYDDARRAAEARAAEAGALLVPAYDDPAVIAGAGTLAREFEEDAPELTHMLVAVGGGGLLGGALAWHGGAWRSGAGTAVVAVEPEGCPALAAALAAGRPVPAPVGGIAADSLGAREIGAHPFALARAHLAASVLVPDAAIRAAQAWLWRACRLVAEPGGATALAALLSGAFTPPEGARVGVVLCGGNADPAAVG